MGKLDLEHSTYYHHVSRPRPNRYADVRPLVREILSRTPNGMGFRQVAMTLRAELEECIGYWNNRRYQAGLNGMTPMQYRDYSIRAA